MRPRQPPKKEGGPKPALPFVDKRSLIRVRHARPEPAAEEAEAAAEDRYPSPGSSSHPGRSASPEAAAEAAAGEAEEAAAPLPSHHRAERRCRPGPSGCG